MIGQQKLLKKLHYMHVYSFPRFVILTGASGGGKKTIVREVASMLGAQLVVCGNKVDEVREVIAMAYKQSIPTLYLFADVDRMSIAAKNALLKVTEESPRQAYFMMTASALESIVPALRSRATCIALDPYTPAELMEYAKQRAYNLSQEEADIVTSVCTVPGEIDLLMKYHVQEFYDYVWLVVDNIGVVNGANAFKIGTKLAYKEEDTGWDLTLFLRTVMLVFRAKMAEGDQSACRASIAVTSKYLNELTSITGVNKPSTVDMWILDLREIWMA